MATDGEQIFRTNHRYVGAAFICQRRARTAIFHMDMSDCAVRTAPLVDELLRNIRLV